MLCPYCLNNLLMKDDREHTYFDCSKCRKQFSYIGLIKTYTDEIKRLKELSVRATDQAK